MPVENPATKPAAEPVEGENLTAKQAALILAVFEANPDEVIDEATELEMSEDDIDDLVGMLSEMAGEDDEAGTEEKEADPNEEEEDAE